MDRKLCADRPFEVSGEKTDTKSTAAGGKKIGPNNTFILQTAVCFLNSKKTPVNGGDHGNLRMNSGGNENIVG